MIRKILNGIAKWYLFPSTPQSRARARFLRKFEEGLPKLIRYYESRDGITDDERKEVEAHVELYREAYRQAEASDNANVTLGQADSRKDANIERDIIRLENAVGGYDK